MADPTTIKCSKCYIYKPRLNFVKDSPLKKLLKLYQLSLAPSSAVEVWPVHDPNQNDTINTLYIPTL